MLSVSELGRFPVGFELGTGEPVSAEYHHLAIFGLTQKAGKTTALEGFISRLNGDFRVLVFRTGRGDLGFESAVPIPFYFRERADWRFVEGLLTAHLDEKNKILRADIMRTCRKAKTLAQVWDNVKAKLETVRQDSFAGSVYTQLDEYLSEVVPEISRVPFSQRLELADRISLMDLEGLSVSMQQLIIAASVDYVMQHLTNVIVVLPEGWNFIPGNRNTPVKLSIQKLVREGAKLHNFLWVDSQTLTGLDMGVMRSVGVWLFGREDLPLEAERFVESIGQKGLKADEIRSLDIGQFYLVQGRDVKKVYVRPSWLDEEQSRKIALGGPLIARPSSRGETVDRPIKGPEQRRIQMDGTEIAEREEKMADEELRGKIEELEKKIRELETGKAKKQETTAPEKPEPEPVTVTTEVEAYDVTIKRRENQVRKFSTSGFQGRILYLMVTRKALRWGRDGIIGAAADLGWKMDSVNTGRQMAALAGLGFLIRDEGPPVSFRLPEGVRVVVEE